MDTRVELVVTTCCVDATSVNTQYNNLAATAVSVATLHRPNCQNCNVTDSKKIDYTVSALFLFITFVQISTVRNVMGLVFIFKFPFSML